MDIVYLFVGITNVGSERLTVRLYWHISQALRSGPRSAQPAISGSWVISWTFLDLGPVQLAARLLGSSCGARSDPHASGRGQSRWRPARTSRSASRCRWRTSLLGASRRVGAVNGRVDRRFRSRCRPGAVVRRQQGVAAHHGRLFSAHDVLTPGGKNSLHLPRLYWRISTRMWISFHLIASSAFGRMAAWNVGTFYILYCFYF